MKEITPWIEEKMATVDFGHKARENRLKLVMSPLAATPAAKKRQRKKTPIEEKE